MIGRYPSKGRQAAQKAGQRSGAIRRTAHLTYREQRRAGAPDLVAWRAAVVTLQAVCPPTR